jgi:mRNA-degrading endonuclease toxin of MazEF toxin-antitoxin module
MNLQRGEIIRINLNPTQGREQQGNARPCIILSNTGFNQRRQGIVIVLPITSIIKPAIKTLIPLPEGLKIKGSVVAEQIRTLDLKQRWWKTTLVILEEKFVDSVTHIVRQIIS